MADGCACCAPGMLGRRTVIRAAVSGLTAAAVGDPLAAALATGAGERRLALRRVQTGERFDGVYWRDGRLDREALRRLDWVLRDPSMGVATPMDPRLFDVLSTVAARLNASAPFEVVSGYRTPQTNANLERGRVSTVSLHMSGMAADLRLPGYDALGFARQAATLSLGGVGLYRADSFVHLDCGPVRRW